jgi:predicted PhzF superfamily epimerase YddE/YHI9
MSETLRLHTLRVFVDQQRKFGNFVGIVVDEKVSLTVTNRQSIAAQTGFSETVFIDNLSTGTVQIFNPQQEVAFAGHALVGTAYFITQTIGNPLTSLICKNGEVQIWHQDELTWIRSSLDGTPAWHLKQLPRVTTVESLTSTETLDHTLVWSWIDQQHGTIRARTFAPDWGIPEDEANGSGVMQLAALLGRRIRVIHGQGSIMYANPLVGNFAEVGGAVVYDHAQPLPRG